jgi:hypothetical protein
MTDQQLEQMHTLDAAQGPALPIDAAHANTMVEAALVGAGFGPPPTGGGTTGSGPTGSGTTTGARMATGTKVAIVGGAALAVIVVALVLAGRRAPRQELAAVTPDAAVDAAPAGSGSATPDTVVDDEAITIDPPPPPTPPTTTTSRPKHTEKPAAKKTVDDLLGEANAKRAEKQWRDSDLLYGRVVTKAPNSLAAQTALVASGSLHLEHFRDPRGAAKRFRRALELAPSGGVAEDARWGLAEALRALHDDKGEAAALDDFLAHHASSPLASRARKRRAELP